MLRVVHEVMLLLLLLVLGYVSVNTTHMTVIPGAAIQRHEVFRRLRQRAALRRRWKRVYADLVIVPVCRIMAELGSICSPVVRRLIVVD